MSIKVEVIFINNVTGGHIGEIKEFHEDSLLLKALILGGHVHVINPPDWELYG